MGGVIMALNISYIKDSFVSAIFFDQLAEVKRQIEEGAEVNKIRTSEDHTALAVAILCFRPEIAEELVANGASECYVGVNGQKHSVWDFIATSYFAYDKNGELLSGEECRERLKNAIARGKVKCHDALTQCFNNSLVERHDDNRCEEFSPANDLG